MTRNSCSQNRGCFLAHVGGVAVPTGSQIENRGSINIRKYQENCPSDLFHIASIETSMLFLAGGASPRSQTYTLVGEGDAGYCNNSFLSVCVCSPLLLFCFSVYLSSVVPLYNQCLSLFLFSTHNCKLMSFPSRYICPNWQKATPNFEHNRGPYCLPACLIS